MNDKTLVRELIVVVVIKLILIFILWWLFFRTAAPTVDASAINHAWFPVPNDQKSLTVPPKKD